MLCYQDFVHWLLLAVRASSHLHHFLEITVTVRYCYTCLLSVSLPILSLRSYLALLAFELLLPGRGLSRLSVEGPKPLKSPFA
jgi:hypothetical protein